MDRVNRSFLVIAAVLAVPAALGMTSLSTGDSPHVTPAIALESDDSGAVQQVVGKQIKSRPTRPGLLQVITGNRSEGSRDHRHENMTQVQPKGLLDTLFEGRSNSSRSRTQSTNQNHRHQQGSQNHGNRNTPAASNDNRSTTTSNDWEGIPYHQVNGARPRTGSEPIRDPQVEMPTGPTRVIRGGAIPARTVSSRRPSNGPTLAPPPAPPLAVPTPPADIEPLPTPFRSSSSQSSSRRSNRRTLEPLDPTEIAAAAKSESQQIRETELVPRVSRKQVATKPESSRRSQQTASAPPTTKPLAAPKPLTSPVETPEPGTALATITAPPTAELPEPKSPLDSAPITLESSPAATATPAPAPAESAIPVAGIPAHPYAATTPSASVPSISASHRSGPPSAAFQPTEPQFKTTASPVGSGVAPNGDVASFRSEPVEPSGEPSLGGYTVPQPERAAGVQGRMTTFGQPVAAPVESTTSAATTAPAQPVPPQPSSSPQVADNFSRTEYDGRNQMRDAGGAAGSAASTSELPGIRVLTHGPATMMLRQTSQYEIRVENRGSIDATGVMVRATVPQWAELRSRNATRGNIDNEVQGSTERLVWKIDQLPAGSSEQMVVRLTASQSGTFNLDVDWTLVPQKSITQVQVHEPKLDLTIEGPDEVVFGKSQTYKVRVLNPGDGTAPNVVFTLSPNSATPQTQRIGDIPPGKEAQFDVELTAQDLGDLQIHGLASGDLDLRTESVKTIKVAAAKLEAIFSGPELKYQNTEAMYSLQVENTGAAASERILASLRLPSGVQYLGGMDQATLQGKTLKWEITSLPPGATRDYQFRCSMTSTGEHLFVFDCSGTAAGSAGVSIATRVESIADLVLTVSDPPAPAPIGSEVTYEIVIRNRGSKEATDVKAIAQFSHGIEPQRIEGQRGEVVTGQVVFDSIPRIGAGQEVRMRVIAKAESGGHHRFRTEVQAGDTVLVAEEATHYMSPKSDRVSRRSSDGESR